MQAKFIEIDKNWKKICQLFLIAFLTGLFVHMYILTNKLINYDEASCPFGGGGNVTFGRWFYFILMYLTKKIMGIYSAQWLYGVISIVCLSASVVCILLTYDVKNRVNQVLVIFLFMSFPVIPVTLAFMFLSPFYCFGIFLGSLSVLLATKGEKRFCFLVSAILLACSMGIYQAYVGYILGLLLLYLISLCKNSSYQLVLKRVVLFLAVAVVGGLFYYIANKMMLFITHTEMTDYKGINSAGKLAIGNWLQRITHSYRVFFQSFISDYYGLTENTVFRIAFLITIIVSVAFMFIKIMDRIVKVLYMFFLALLPLVINMMFVVCEEKDIYTLMVFPFIVILIMPIILIDVINLEKKSIASTIIVLAVIFEVADYATLDNEIYMKMQMAYNQAFSYYNTVVTQIKSLDKYEADMPVAFVGNVSDPTLTSWDEFSNIKNIHGIGEEDGLINIYSRTYFVQNYVGFSPAWIVNTKEIETTEEFRNMSVYPDAGSIQIIDGTVVVKFE
ncbi:MAG: glucosyltransferase domain-containing protein [Lachnospiraceae bacterium]|nr:glucosyltransferase domain-containing protein [Lachnospiraceae bacterium]